MKVRDVMQQDVITARSDAPLREAATAMLSHAISGLPVVDPEGRVVGVISEGDFVVKELGARALHHRPLAWLLGESPETRSELQKATAVSVGAAMTTPAITIDPDRTLRDAAALMIERQVNRLPVLDKGQLVGIVTRADIVRAFVRPDDELEIALRESILRVFWVDASEIGVKVDMGVARVSGTADTRSTAELLRRFIEEYEGVVAVEGTLGWRVDDHDMDSSPSEAHLQH